MPRSDLLLAFVGVVACAALTIGLIVLIKPLLIRYVVARVNDRSSHKVPTPQGAGLAVMLGVIIVCAGALWMFPPAHGGSSLFIVIGAAAGLTLLGLADDAHALPVGLRFLGQAIAAALVVWTLPDGLWLFPDILPFAVERVLLAIGVVYFVNAVNFLDGIDLITAAQVVPMTLGIAVLTLLGAAPPIAGILAIALCGGMLGFAWFNRHPASVFLGDAGSLPIGLCLAWMLILVAGVSKSAAILLALYTLADSMLTLGRRAWNREPIFSAHRSHFYQRAISNGYGVPQVSLLVFLLGILLAHLAVAAVVVQSPLLSGAFLAFGGLATGLVLYLFSRGPR